MKRKIRIGTAAGALGAAVVLLLPLANGAGAATSVADYQMSGVARGVSFGFGFKEFVLQKILDIGIPHASNDLNTSAGASAMSEAAIAYPGDVLVGALQNQIPGGIPGYAASTYPPGQSQNRNVTGSLFGNDIPLPNQAGPLGVDVGHLETNARERVARSSTTTQRLIIGEPAAPFLTIGSINATSSAEAQGAGVTQIARTIVHDLVITPSADFAVRIGSIVSQATATSDGTNGDGAAAMTLSDVRVLQAGTEYAATIDSKGVHIKGPIPEATPNLNSVDIDLGQNVSDATKGLANSGLTIRAAEAFRSVDGAASEASIGGLVIGLSGDIPRIPVAQQLVTATIGPIIDQNFPTYCPARDPVPGIGQPLPPPFDAIAKALPVCFTPQLIPTGGNGTITSLSIGSVDAISDASTGFEPTPIGGGGGFGGPPVGGLGPDLGGGPGFGNGGVPPGSVPGAQPGNTQLFGLVAKMPPGALLAGGLSFLVIAMAMTIGPSLRRWRAT